MLFRSPGRRALNSALAFFVAFAGYAALVLVALDTWSVPLPDASPPLRPVISAPSAPGFGIDSVPDRLGPGDGLGSVLRRNGVPAQEQARLTESLRSVVDLRRLRSGQTLWLHRNRSGLPVRVELELDGFRMVSADRAADGSWQASETVVDPEVDQALVTGTVLTSVYESLLDAGEQPELAVLIGTVLEYQLDLRRDTRRGDTWTVLVDKLSTENGFLGYGETHAVRFVNQGEELFALRYQFPDGSSGYYDENGKALRRAFLVSPVRYTRISGFFTNRRLHPVHRVYRPHYGVDYAAPHGAPVVATGNGVITDAGMRGPNGNMVTIRHPGGFQTKYLHLSRIPGHIRPGRRVEQRDLIGYVGSTGTSTGPHVDYRLYRDGRPINPRATVLPEGPPIEEQYRLDFESRRDALLLALRGAADESGPAERATVALAE